jgi:penicillin-binding protein-related factor A (putative recombinase)
VTKNTGKPSEQIFDQVWRSQGKTAFCFAFTDASEATGTNKRVTNIKAQPSDRLLFNQGAVELAEVKSTVDPRNFPFSLLRPKQAAFAAYALAAGGTYVVYVHSLHLNLWFRVPYQKIISTKEAGRSSIPWTDLLAQEYQWKHPHLSLT